MSPTDQALAWLSAYGLPVLFGVILIASAGVPFPITFMLIAAGSFVELGELNLWPVIVLGVCGAVIGDQIGYGIGRWGSGRAVRIAAWISSEQKWKQAEAAARRWGGPGIFFSRWLITPLGPCINFASGIAEYSWPRFLMWSIAGETIWVVLYVMLGKLFSDRVQAMKDMIGNLTWAFVGLLACVVFGWKLIQYMRAPRPTDMMPLAEVAADPPDRRAPPRSKNGRPGPPNEAPATDAVADPPAPPLELQTVHKVLESDSVVCEILFDTVYRTKGPPDLNPLRPHLVLIDAKGGIIQSHVERTGGIALQADKDNINDKFAQLIRRLRTRYSIGYLSSNAAGDGKLRKIKLTVTPEVEKREGSVGITTKRGYYAR